MREDLKCYTIVSDTNELWELFKSRLEGRTPLLYPGTIYTITFDNINFNIIKYDWLRTLTFSKVSDDSEKPWDDKISILQPEEEDYYNVDVYLYDQYAVDLWNGNLNEETAFVNNIISFSPRTFLERAAALVTVLEDIPEDEIENILQNAYNLQMLPAIQG